MDKNVISQEQNFRARTKDIGGGMIGAVIGGGGEVVLRSTEQPMLMVMKETVFLELESIALVEAGS